MASEGKQGELVCGVNRVNRVNRMNRVNRGNLKAGGDRQSEADGG